MQRTTDAPSAEGGAKDDVIVGRSATVGTDEPSPSEPARQPSRPPTKTPAFQAMHAVRYKRQELINAIQLRTGRKLISYTSGAQAEISRDDTVFLVDLLHNIPSNEDLDFLLHTPGGDIDAAEKLITMVRNKVGTATLRVVIPDFAKSSGTLMALGADFIVMSDSSELGPIDPQIVMADGNGTRITTPILSYLGAYKEHCDTLSRDPTNVAAQVMLGKLDPTRVKLFETALQRARTIAESQLRQAMFRDKPGNHTAIVSKLLDPHRWLSHGQMISAADALDIGLAVEIMQSDDELWQLYWQLHCYQRLDLTERHKLFESSYASLVCETAA
ncbi:SDH family Clp fold serine proteinase [Variovorax paradoxus]|uniref:SDH family Clp fold serine proteinase n=1 Tax=Variovorax paradoxus TaxID=34073 RepID=UPI003ECF0560